MHLDFFFLTSPVVERRTLLISSFASQTSKSFSRIRTSTMAPARCLPTLKTWLDTEIVPLTETVRFTQSSPERSSVVARRSRASGGAEGWVLEKNRCAGGAMPRHWWGRSVL